MNDMYRPLLIFLDDIDEAPVVFYRSVWIFVVAGVFFPAVLLSNHRLSCCPPTARCRHSRRYKASLNSHAIWRSGSRAPKVVNAGLIIVVVSQGVATQSPVGHSSGHASQSDDFLDRFVGRKSVVTRVNGTRNIRFRICTIRPRRMCLSASLQVTSGWEKINVYNCLDRNIYSEKGDLLLIPALPSPLAPIYFKHHSPTGVFRGVPCSNPWNESIPMIKP